MLWVDSVMGERRCRAGMARGGEGPRDGRAPRGERLWTRDDYKYVLS